MAKKITKTEILLRAAELIDKGWIQGEWFANRKGEPVDIDKACRFCADGAISRASLDLGATTEQTHAAYFAVNDITNADHSTSVIGFNDRVAKNKREVADLLVEAALK